MFIPKKAKQISGTFRTAFCTETLFLTGALSFCRRATLASAVISSRDEHAGEEVASILCPLCTQARGSPMAGFSTLLTFCNRNNPMIFWSLGFHHQIRDFRRNQALYRHIRNYYLSNSKKTLQDGNGKGNFEELNSNDFQDGNWESMEMKG